MLNRYTVILLFATITVIQFAVSTAGSIANDNLNDFNDNKKIPHVFSKAINHMNMEKDIPASSLHHEYFHRDSLPLFDIRVDPLPEKCQNLSIPSNCAEATACTKRSGYYRIKVDKYSSSPFLVECDAHTQGGDWTIIQRRQDGSVNFYRKWAEYKVGFGDMDGEHFIGMDKLYALTNYDGPQELLILMVDKNATGYFNYQAKYSSFAIDSEKEKYQLKRIGIYTGNAGNSLKDNIGQKFSTQDMNNGPTINNCAVSRMGAWWYYNCGDSNLNGNYGDKTSYKGINWWTITRYDKSLETVVMLLRRRRN